MWIYFGKITANSEASQVTTPDMSADEKKRAIIAALSSSVEAYKLASTV